MTKHTQGRLRVTRDPMHWDSLTTIEGGLVGVKKPFMPELLVQVGGDADVLKAEANARRLVACWNRLEKFTTEQIEDLGYDLFADVRPDFERAMRERDELLGALKLAHGALSQAAADLNDWGAYAPAKHKLADDVQAYVNAAESVRAAIAKVESK